MQVRLVIQIFQFLNRLLWTLDFKRYMCASTHGIVSCHSLIATVCKRVVDRFESQAQSPGSSIELRHDESRDGQG